MCAAARRARAPRRAPRPETLGRRRDPYDRNLRPEDVGGLRAAGRTARRADPPRDALLPDAARHAARGGPRRVPRRADVVDLRLPPRTMRARRRDMDAV